MKQVFLDWNQPALSAATDFLIRRYAAGGMIDLSNVIVVVPGGRAGRRLGEILLQKTETAGNSYLPPNITTVGGLPEMLYQPRFPFAGKITQQLAWTRALRETQADNLKKLVKMPPAKVADSRWVEIASMLQQQHRELAGDGFNFNDVLRVGQDLKSFGESDRWIVLADIQQRYLKLLDKLQIWDRQTARLKAIEFNECRTEQDIVLVATADVNRVMRKMLDQVTDKVTSLVFAPDALQDRFDAYGCLNIPAWQSATLDILDKCILSVNDASEQSEAIVHAIANFGGAYTATEITIGVPDETTIPHIEYAMRQAELSPRWGPGDSLERSRPIRFLRSVVDYLNEQNFDNLAELLRNPDVGRWLRGKHEEPNRLLVKLDRFQRNHLPSTANHFTARMDRTSVPAQAARRIADLLKPLTGADRLPGQWAPCIVEVLSTLFGSSQVDLENPVQRATLAAVDVIREALHELQLIPDVLAEAIPASSALLMLLSQTRGTMSPRFASEDSIELLGWLELSLDDAPAKIIASFNEGFVPSSIDADLFLPNSLRTQLGIDDSQRLYARDIYAASAIVASTPELRVVVGRYRGDGEPSLPSRLLFAADDETVLRRSIRFFADESNEDQPEWNGDAFPQRHRFLIPRLAKLPGPIEELSVTAFRSYLACPYRFYLQHILKLDEATDGYTELDPRSFGTLTHAVLEDFGSGPEKDSQDVAIIADFLDNALDERVKESYGRRVRPAVRIQVEQLRLRLHAFARRQVRWRDSGWKIHSTERDTKQIETVFKTERNEIRLVGRIDRIDRNEANGRYAILDYKTSEIGTPPDRTHRKRGEWVDLQLPLYRHFVEPLGSVEPVELGYVVLPNETSKVDFITADWTNEELLDADKVASRVVDSIRDEIFWPPTRPAPAFSEVFAAICQDTVFDRGNNLTAASSQNPDATRGVNQETSL